MQYDPIRNWALCQPDKVAFKDLSSNETITYSELEKQTIKLAQHLSHQYQIEAGDRVAVIAKNSFFSPILFFALQKLAAIHVPVNFRLKKAEIDYIVSDCQPKLIISDGENAWKPNQKHTLEQNLLEESYLFEDQNPDTLSNTSSTQQSCNFDDPIQILYTSGTTGFPKGALITRKMIFFNAVSTSMRLGLTGNDRFINFMPFFHTGGWNVLLTPFLHNGATTLLMSQFDPQVYLQHCEKEKATILFGVPTTLDMMAEKEDFADIDLSSVRFAVVGGEPMPLPLIEKWNNKGIAIRQGYGLTEFGPNVFSLAAEDCINKKGSVGFVNPLIEVEIRDEQGHLTQGPGELFLRGPAKSPGYWNQPQSEDDWLATGDLFEKDADGFYYVVGRKKDMFISGGENVYPAEVEQVLRQHPQVAEAAVIGIENSKWGEVGKAFIVCRQESSTQTKAAHEISTDELDSFCRSRLANFKVPKEFAFLTQLPKGDSGKILKRQLREL